MANKNSDAVGVGIHPPFLLGGMLGLVLLYKAFDLPSPLHGRKRWFGIPLILSGIILSGWAAKTQAQAGTPVVPTYPTRVLVEHGPYRLSRNPIYLGMVTLFAGFSVLMNALWALLLLPAMMMALDQGMIRHEENYLERKFGQQYLAYKDRVGRWI